MPVLKMLSVQEQIAENERLYYESPLILSHSLRGVLNGCQRKYEFASRFRATGQTEDEYAADCGTALHIGVQAFTKTRDYNTALFEFMRNFPYETEFGSTNGDMLSTSQLRSRQVRSFEACIAVFDKIVTEFNWDRYEIATFEITNSRGEKQVVDGIEISFAIEMLNTGINLPVFFMGHIDLILRDTRNGELVVFDIKTTRKQLTEARWTYDQQTRPYGLVISALTGQEITHFSTHYLAAYIDVMEPQCTDFEILCTEREIADWVYGIAEDIHILRRSLNRGLWLRTSSGSQCVSYNSTCKFYQHCSMRDVALLASLLERPEDDKFYNPDKALVHSSLDMKEFM